MVPSPQVDAMGSSVVSADDPGQRRLVGVRAYVGVRGPDQLVAGDAVAGRGHAAQAEVGGVGEDGGEQGVHVVAALAGAQVGEGGREARHPVHLVQQLGDARQAASWPRSRPQRREFPAWPSS